MTSNSLPIYDIRRFCSDEIKQLAAHSQTAHTSSGGRESDLDTVKNLPVKVAFLAAS